MVKKKVVIMAVKTFNWREDEGEDFRGFITRIRKRIAKRLKTEDARATSVVTCGSEEDEGCRGYHGEEHAYCSDDEGDRPCNDVGAPHHFLG